MRSIEDIDGEEINGIIKALYPVDSLPALPPELRGLARILSEDSSFR